MPDLVLSGVNRGQNIADDVTYSGTIAAAMEGTALGLKSIALSQVMGIHDKGIRFDVAEHSWRRRSSRKLIDLELGPGVLINVNFPIAGPTRLQGVEVTRQGKRDQNLLIVDERMDRAASTITGSASSASAAIRRSAPICAPPSTSASR